MADKKCKVFVHFSLFNNLETIQIDRFLSIMKLKKIENYLFVALLPYQPTFKYENDHVLIISKIDEIYEK